MRMLWHDLRSSGVVTRCTLISGMAGCSGKVVVDEWKWEVEVGMGVCLVSVVAPSFSLYVACGLPARDSDRRSGMHNRCEGRAA